MAVENDKIKDLFSSKLGSFEPEVPTSVWGGLDQLLSSQPAPVTDPGSSSSSTSSTTNATSAAGKASIIKTVAIAVGITAAVATGIVLMPDSDKDESKEIMVEEVQTPVEPEIIDTTTLMPDIPIAIMGIPKTTVAKAKAEAIVPVTEPEEQDMVDVRPFVEKDIVAIEEKEPMAEETVLAVEEEMAPEIKILGGGFSVGIHASTNLFSDNINQQGGGLLFSHDVRSSAFMEELSKENANYQLKHKQPVSFGVTISKQIVPKLSLETGLIYTHLSSEMTSESKFGIDESQSFNYLGIPLSLNYTFYQIGNTRFYISVGGMFQKDIKGKYISDVSFQMEEEGTTGRLFYSEPYYIKKSIKQDNPQFSVHSTLGVSYPIYKKLYLYGTIGGVYYFEAGNKYRTIYSDKKLQLNMNAGLKLDF